MVWKQDPGLPKTSLMTRLPRKNAPIATTITMSAASAQEAGAARAEDVARPPGSS
jgi:hypothetical protein